MEWGKNRERKAERRKDKMQRSPEGIMELLSREGGLIYQNRSREWRSVGKE